MNNHNNNKKIIFRPGFVYLFVTVEIRFFVVLSSWWLLNCLLFRVFFLSLFSFFFILVLLACLHSRACLPKFFKSSNFFSVRFSFFSFFSYLLSTIEQQKTSSYMWLYENQSLEVYAHIYKNNDHLLRCQKGNKYPPLDQKNNNMKR